VIAARVQAAANRNSAPGQAQPVPHPREIDHYCKLDRLSKFKLRESMQSFQWSSRAYHRILRVARTIADLDGFVDIQKKHVEEAIQYRRALIE
jgi:magnesium chelatase family protein